MNHLTLHQLNVQLGNLQRDSNVLPLSTLPNMNALEVV